MRREPALPQGRMGVRHKNRGELYAFYCGMYEFGSRSRSADRDRLKIPLPATH